MSADTQVAEVEPEGVEAEGEGIVDAQQESEPSLSNELEKEIRRAVEGFKRADSADGKLAGCIHAILVRMSAEQTEFDNAWKLECLTPEERKAPGRPPGNPAAKVLQLLEVRAETGKGNSGRSVLARFTWEAHVDWALENDLIDEKPESLNNSAFIEKVITGTRDALEEHNIQPEEINSFADRFLKVRKEYYRRMREGNNDNQQNSRDDRQIAEEGFKRASNALLSRYKHLKNGLSGSELREMEKWWDSRPKIMKQADGYKQLNRQRGS